MTLDYIICVPVYKDTQRVENCMESLSGLNVLIIDNSGEQQCKRYEEKYGYKVLYQTENIGIPRAWNLGLEQGKDWTFIISSSMIFNKSFSDIFEMVENFSGLIFRTDHAWHCIGIHKDVVSKVGYFDHNFYPGYLEDCDYDYRARLAGIPEFDNHKIDAICQVSGAATLDGLEVRIEPLREYFVSKWNGVEQNHLPLGKFEGTPTVWSRHKSLFTKPFGNPDNELSFWQERAIQELRKDYGFQ